MADRAAFILRLLTGRRPGDRELLALEALYREQYDEFRSGRADAQKLLAVGDAPRDSTIDPAECAALTVLAQAVMNYDGSSPDRVGRDSRLRASKPFDFQGFRPLLEARNLA